MFDKFKSKKNLMLVWYMSLMLITGCSSLNRPRKVGIKGPESSIDLLNNPQIHEWMTKVCLTSQGRGKLEHLENSERFSYQALLDNEPSWTLGFVIPFKSMQTFKIQKAQDGKSYALTGSFPDPKIASYFTNEHLAAIGEFLQMRQFGIKEQWIKGWAVYWNYSDSTPDLQELVWVKVLGNENAYIKIRLLEKKSTIFVESNTANNQLFSITLYPSKCSL